MIKEEKLILDILFNEINIKDYDICDINEKKLMSILTSHLILPTFYSILKRKKFLTFFNKDLIVYMKEIYNINYSRNLLLIEECKIISNIFTEHNIDYVFLKGSANILSDLYNDIGVRMVGDVDILVKKKSASKAFNLIKKIGYKSDENIFFSSKRHLPRLKNKEKLFSIEIHTGITDKVENNKICSELILRNKCCHNGFFTPNFESMILTNIYNHQINDYGYVKFSYSLRNLYDSFLIQKKVKNIFDANDRYVKRYLSIAEQMNISSFKNVLKINNCERIQFYFFNRLKFFKKINYLLVACKLKSRNLPDQIYLYLTNKDYRKYLISKFNL